MCFVRFFSGKGGKREREKDYIKTRSLGEKDGLKTECRVIPPHLSTDIGDLLCGFLTFD